MAELAMPDYSTVMQARKRLHGLAVRTPLLSYPVLDERVGGRVLLKPEIFQRTGSFKFRGAYNRVSEIEADTPGTPVVACSSGNHAQGVAAAATLHGVSSTIIMPADAPAIKRSRTQALGGRLILYDRAHDDRDKIVERACAETGAAFVPPFDDAGVISGQGTVGLEIAEDAGAYGRLDAVLIPAGGGGLTAGIALALGASLPDTRLFTVEPAGFDDHARSFASGSRQSNASRAGSICDALLSEQPGQITFAINGPRASGGLCVSDDEARQAVAYAFRELKLVVEPGGAVALAALLSGKLDVSGKTVCAVLSGGNIDPELFGAIIADGTG